VLLVAHRTLSGAQAEHQNELAALGFFQSHSSIIHQIVRRTNGEMVKCAQWLIVVNSEQWTTQKSEVRTAKSKHTGLSGVPLDFLVPQEDKRLQWSTAPNPNGLLTWHGSDSEQCHVRCTTGLSGVTIDSNDSGVNKLPCSFALSPLDLFSHLLSSLSKAPLLIFI
jgi:hypothetical protein